MTPDEVKQIETNLTKLEKLLEQSKVLDEDDEQVVQPNDIKNAMDELSRTVNSIINRIENSTPAIPPDENGDTKEPDDGDDGDDNDDSDDNNDYE